MIMFKFAQHDQIVGLASLLSNGLAEQAVQTFKHEIKKQVQGTVETKVARFLFSYRTTLQTTTGKHQHSYGGGFH